MINYKSRADNLHYQKINSCLDVRYARSITFLQNKSKSVENPPILRVNEIIHAIRYVYGSKRILHEMQKECERYE